MGCGRYAPACLTARRRIGSLRSPSTQRSAARAGRSGKGSRGSPRGGCMQPRRVTHPSTLSQLAMSRFSKRYFTTCVEEKKDVGLTQGNRARSAAWCSHFDRPEGERELQGLREDGVEVVGCDTEGGLTRLNHAGISILALSSPPGEACRSRRSCSGGVSSFLITKDRCSDLSPSTGYLGGTAPSSRTPMPSPLRASIPLDAPPQGPLRPTRPSDAPLPR
jgi:hypothetical protein